MSGLREEQSPGADVPAAAAGRAVPDLLFTIDREGRILEFHAPPQRRLRMPPERFLGKKADEFLPPATARLLQESLRRTLEQGPQPGVVIPMSFPEGERWYEAFVVPQVPPEDGTGRLQVILCDIFSDMLAFVDAFRIHMGFGGAGLVCDLVERLPDQPVQAALLLKTIPCLEQLQKGIGSRLLEGINAETLVVTYPAASLGGRNKGMRKTYADQFAELIEGKPWHVRGLEIGSELVYIVRK